jgi:hypothetical protein
MATYHAVPAVGGAIIGLLKAAPHPPEFDNSVNTNQINGARSQSALVDSWREK